MVTLTLNEHKATRGPIAEHCQTPKTCDQIDRVSYEKALQRYMRLLADNLPETAGHNLAHAAI